MGTNNLGKVFEKNFKESSQKQGLWTYRIMDSDLSFCGGNSRFTKQNIADFLIFDTEQRNLFLVECKSTHYKSISMDRESGDNKMIKLHQIQNLSENNQFDHIYSVFVFNFRNEDELHNIVDEDTYIMGIDDFNNFYCETDKASINKLDIVNHNGVRVDQQRKRKFFTYEIKKGLEDFVKVKGG